MADPSQADIIVVGAGTAGLVLANELSNDPTLRVHVFEAGKDCTDNPDTRDVSAYTANLGSERDWQFDSVPQDGFNGRRALQCSGKLLGGSSAMNGGYYVAPSRVGVDAWAGLGNHTWSSDRLQKACIQTVQSHPPDQNVCTHMDLDWHSNGDESTAEPGRVQVTGILEEHPITKAYFRSLKDLGYRNTTSLFNEHSALGQTVNLTQDPSSMTRSDANSAFGLPLRKRPNVTIFLEATVQRVILEGAEPNVSARGVEVVDDSGHVCRFHASKEVILAAGSLNTPKLLELSGIGQPDVLLTHQIPLIIENAYVGERLRNHVMAMTHCQLNDEAPAMPLGMQAMAYMASKDQPGLTEVLNEHTATTGDDQSYDREVKRIFLGPKEGSGCHFVGFLGVPNAITFGVIMAVPFSAGRTHITSSDVRDKPTVDPRFYSHPLDLEVVSRHLRTAANFAARPALRPFFKMDAHERPVGAVSAMSEDMEKIKAFLREESLTTYHACGTASMRPREDGGVVDECFKVYGTANLRVVDASVIPLIPHGNTMAAVYGIAKIAAGIIGEATKAK